MIGDKSLYNFFQNIINNYSLIHELSKREFLSKYKGSILGKLWSILQPMIMLLIYSLVFIVILKSKWGLTESSEDFVLLLFLGLIIHKMIADVLTDGPLLIINNTNYVKKIIFPIEILSIVHLIVSTLQAIISIIIWLCAYYYLHGSINLNSFYIFIIYICYVPLLLGLSLIISSLGVFFRDIHQVSTLISTALLFLTPIFYSLNSAPSLLQNILSINPLTFIVEQSRLAMFYNLDLSMNLLTNYFIGSFIFLLLSIAFYKRLQPKFADML